MPVELWSRVHVVAAARGLGPGGYIKSLVEAAIDRDERALADTLAARGVTPSRARRKS